MNLQIDNINEIEFLRKSLDELCGYGIDIEFYKSKLDTAIVDYESSKKRELDNEFSRLDGKMVADLENSAEVSLCLELEKLSNSLVWYMLFLDLMHVTDDWNLEVKINDVFSRIYNKLDKVLECFVSIDLQKKVISRYYDLVLKKLLIDYENNSCEHIDEFDNLGKNVYLTDSVNRYFRYNNIWVDGRIDSYSLRKVIDKINDRKDDIDKVLPISRSNMIDCNKFNFFEQYNCSFEDISWLGDDYELIKKIIDVVGIENIKYRDLSYCNLEGIDLSKVNFTGVYIKATILKNTGARIDPQKVCDKDLRYCDLEGIDLGDVDFTEIKISGTNLKNTGAKIDPQKVFDNDMHYCDFFGCFLINNFSGYSDLIFSFYLNGAIIVDSFDDIPMIKRLIKRGEYHQNVKLNGLDDLYMIEGQLVNMKEEEMKNSKYYKSLKK